jgi:type I restriction enzyme S subunit
VIEGLKPYPEYRATAQGWLDSTPSHWQVKRAKWNFRKLARSIADGAETVTSFRDGTVTLRRNRRTTGFTEAIKEFGYQGVCRGDLVIHAMDAFAGAAGVSDADGKCSPVCSVCEATGSVLADYAAHVVREMARSQWIVALGRGIRERSTDFRFDDFREQLLPVPPLDEQRAIVRFLDYAERRIRKYIAAKRKLISLLEEQKRAIILQAVTRGLDPNVRLKDSGVPWIGMVPEHWEAIPNRTLLRIRKCLVGESHNDYALLSLTKQGVVVRDMNAGGKFSSFADRQQEVRAGDLVFCLFDVDETPRAVGLAACDGMISPDYTVMECRDKATGAYLECFYTAMDDGKLLKPLYTGLRKRISKPLLLAAKTAVPPDQERDAIVTFIREHERSAVKLMRETAVELDRLVEFRARLISDIVTGKLDVRQAAALLPDDRTAVPNDTSQSPDDRTEDSASEEDEA